MIDFKCQRCRQQLSVPDSLVGQQEQCPHCGKTNIVPSQDQAAKNPLTRKGPTSLDTISSWLQGTDFSSLDLNAPAAKKKNDSAARQRPAHHKGKKPPQT
ncbi:MAG: hypothetical protein HZA50_02025 [Planctomycetes bacterium]|nr:hypothetical protein [Planctomycetota bacterium]